MPFNLSKKRKLKLPKKVLILGSGALKIGEAGEFDYSGSQAIKALKEDGVKTVLVNPNIATNQTSRGLADKVYFLPVDSYFVEKIIKKEHPDGILLGFGGQTALNCGLELDKKGILRKNGVCVLGTPIIAIEKTEDRALFNNEILNIGMKVPRSIACDNKKAAVEAAKEVGYPVIVRAAFALGGKGSGFAYGEEELSVLLDTAFAYSNQALVEENLKGWKELEYEVVRDGHDNCITVCNMENFDPLGIHTGESIVVAPSQTLSNEEYHRLRKRAIAVIRHFGIVGECNIQFALDPASEDYRIIEVNARLSRSSALASKATGYPLAYIAAKLALGYCLPELKNAVTKTTTACFEPALDYLALKIPRWDLDKFRMVSQEISSEMKSVGEVMAIGRSFEEVLQKGLRMLQIGLYGFVANSKVEIDTATRHGPAVQRNALSVCSTQGLDQKAENLKKAIQTPTPRRILAIAEALRHGLSTAKISELSGIDCWFLDKLKNIVEIEAEILKHKKLPRPLLEKAKKMGFSDKQLAELTGRREDEIRRYRKKMGIVPVVKQIDTMAAEYPARTNYLYLTYHGVKDDLDIAGPKSAVQPRQRCSKEKIIVLGAGPYAIGTSVEFDWCCVNALRTAGKHGYETIMVNYNPETVSTDYDICDKLYFDELSLERVLDIYEKEKPKSMIVSTGGQVSNNLALKLFDAGVKILGTEAKSIDLAEDRHKFSQIMDKLGIDQPKWKELNTPEQVEKFVRTIGYPVLVRPSYVLSGAAMSVAHNNDDLMRFLSKAINVSAAAPVVISKFEQGAKEIEIDAVALKGNVLIYAIGEHVENAGVHSGDATIVLPPQKLYIETIRRIKTITKKIAGALQITGPFNIQFLAKNNQIKVIECNLRASRSFPFSSKVTGYNFIEIATEAMLGKKSLAYFHKRNYKTLDLDHVGVKVSQFSFSRLKGADPVLGVEMASTGEVACFGQDMHEAFLKAMLSAGFKIPKKHVLLSIGRIEDKADFLAAAQQLIAIGYKLYATEGTSNFLGENNVPNTLLHKIRSNMKPNLLDVLSERGIDLVINIPQNYSREEVTDGYLIRRKAIDFNVPLITNLQMAKMTVEALQKYKLEDLEIKEWTEYVE